MALNGNAWPRLEISIGTPLKMEIEGVDEQVGGVFVGMAPSEFLVVQAPRIFAYRNSLFEGNRLVVRYLYSGRVFGFHCEVAGSLYKPNIKLLFLSYPEKVEELNLRKHERVECCIPSVLTVGESKIKGNILDLSIGGCMFTAQDRNIPVVEVGQKVGLICTLPGVSGTHTLNCITRNVSKDSSKLRLGLQFHDLSSVLLSEIDSYMNHLSFFLNLEEPVGH